jgi:hypothetical protein
MTPGERATVTAILCGMVLVIAFFVVGMLMLLPEKYRTGGLPRVSSGHPTAGEAEVFFVQTAFTIAMLPCLREENILEKNNDDQVNCCRRLSRGRHNFGARNNPGTDSSAGRHALASSLRVRPV